MSELIVPTRPLAGMQGVLRAADGFEAKYREAEKAQAAQLPLSVLVELNGAYLALTQRLDAAVKQAAVDRPALRAAELYRLDNVTAIATGAYHRVADLWTPMVARMMQRLMERCPELFEMLPEDVWDGE